VSALVFTLLFRKYDFEAGFLNVLYINYDLLLNYELMSVFKEI